MKVREAQHNSLKHEKFKYYGKFIGIDAVAINYIFYRNYNCSTLCLENL